MLHKYPYPGQMYDSVDAHLQKPIAATLLQL